MVEILTPIPAFTPESNGTYTMKLVSGPVGSRDYLQVQMSGPETKYNEVKLYAVLDTTFAIKPVLLKIYSGYGFFNVLIPNNYGQNISYLLAVCNNEPDGFALSFDSIFYDESGI